MFQCEEGCVQRITREGDDYQEVVVLIAGEEAKAFAYPRLTGRVQPGERVWLNTTAVQLGLGTGGYHFVIARCDQNPEKKELAGHIMKLRYTPWQFPVLSVEEENSPHHSTVKSFTSLEGSPVLVGTLHSMVAPALLAFHGETPRRRVVYIMTDGAALPLSFSDTVRRLKAKGLLSAVITCGHAFGGDLEAVNIYSALAAAKAVTQAEVIIVAMGPGIVGTGTKYGFSGIEQAYILEAVQRLGGRPVAIPRISFADPRARHRGLSHHSQTVLGELTFATALIALPDWEDERMEILTRQIKESGLTRHHLYQLKVPALPVLMDAYDLPLKTMGRSYHEDPAFFETPAAAGVLANCLLGGELDNLPRWNG